MKHSHIAPERGFGGTASHSQLADDCCQTYHHKETFVIRVEWDNEFADTAHTAACNKTAEIIIDGIRWRARDNEGKHGAMNHAWYHRGNRMNSIRMHFKSAVNLFQVEAQTRFGCEKRSSNTSACLITEEKSGEQVFPCFAETLSQLCVGKFFCFVLISLFLSRFPQVSIVQRFVSGVTINFLSRLTIEWVLGGRRSEKGNSGWHSLLHPRTSLSKIPCMINVKRSRQTLIKQVFETHPAEFLPFPHQPPSLCITSCLQNNVSTHM